MTSVTRAVKRSRAPRDGELRERVERHRLINSVTCVVNCVTRVANSVTRVVKSVTRVVNSVTRVVKQGHTPLGSVVGRAPRDEELRERVKGQRAGCV